MLNLQPKPPACVSMNSRSYLQSAELWVHGNRTRLQDQPFQVLRVLLETARRNCYSGRTEAEVSKWPA